MRLCKWESEDFKAGICTLFLSFYLVVTQNMRIYIYYFPEKNTRLQPLSLSKHEHKSNYLMDNYFKDTLCAGPSKMDKAQEQIAM